MKLEEAGALADRIVHCLESLCVKIQVAGSIRRRRPEVHDIDIVLIPRPLRWSGIVNRLETDLKATVTKAGAKLVSLNVPIGDTKFPVDLYRANPTTWGVLLLIRTGSKKHNVILCMRARALGMMLSAKDGLIKDDKVIASRTEESIFKALDLDWSAPEDREVGS